MTAVITVLAWVAAIAVFVPAFILVAEVIAALAPRRRRAVAPSANPRVGVLIPAHNESDHLLATLGDLKSAAWPGVEIIVVADNCTDDTAEVARDCGVTVIERVDPTRRGKGYALQFGIDHLQSDPPEFVVFFDADCRLGDNVLQGLVAAAAAQGRPAQARYDMTGDADAPSAMVARFAWLMINTVRMLGLDRLAGVTRFTGVGLAAPWRALSSMTFASGAITEDHELTFAFAERRQAPVFVADLVVTSAFPDAGDAVVTQRARWEHGSWRVLMAKAPMAALRAIVTGNRQLFAVALDGLVPPMAGLAAMMVVAGAVALAGLALGVAAPFMIVCAAGLFFVASLAIAWAQFGRTVLPVRGLKALAPFILAKLRIYGAEGRKSAQTWTRTGRD